MSEAAAPRKRFTAYPAYKDSGVEWLGEIPADWEVRRLKTLISDPITDGPHETPEFLPEGIPFLSVDGIQEGELVFGGCRCISEVAHKEYRRKCAPRRDDILLGKAASTGKIARVKVDFEFSVWSPLALIRPDHTEARSEFLEYALKSAATQAQIDVLCTTNTQKNISMRDIPVLVVCVAPLPQQHAIAAFLDRETARIDALVAKKERLIELLQEKRTALITRAVTKGLDPNVPMKGSGVEWLGEIPAHWEVSRVKNLSKFVTSGSRGWAEHYTDDGSLFLRIGNLSTASIDLDLSDVQHVTPPPGAEGERTRVRTGDVLISITALIGAVGVVIEGTPAAFVNQHLALVRLSKEEVRPRWLGYCLLSRVGQQQLRSDLYGGTKDGLSLDDIRSLTVLIPPGEEQERIVDILDNEGRHVDALVAKVRVAIDRLKELRTALISAAVTGKIDVRELTA